MKHGVAILMVLTFISCKDKEIINSVSKQKALYTKEIGNKYFLEKDYFKALEHYYESLDYYRSIHDTLEISKITNNIGSVYSNAGFQSMALSFYFDAFTERKKLNDVEGIAKLYYNIGRSYENNNQTAEARSYLFLADSLFSVMDNSSYSSMIHNEIGRTYRVDSNYLEARKYYQKAQVEGIGNGMAGKLLNNIGYSYSCEGNHIQALSYYRRAMKYQSDLMSNDRTRLYQNLAEIHQNKDSVAWYYTRSFKENLVWIDKLYLDATHMLYNYHKAIGITDSADYYYNLQHQAGLRTLEQRDELQKSYELYQVKYGHDLRQKKEEVALIEKKQLWKLLISGIISGVLMLTLLFNAYKKRMVREKIKRLLKHAPSVLNV
jgi:tetratricopeptide (TPR) repeat protein